MPIYDVIYDMIHTAHLAKSEYAILIQYLFDSLSWINLIKILAICILNSIY